jgi:hypothetical protein
MASFLLPVSCTIGFQVHMAASMKVSAFWDIAPCSVVEIHRRLEAPNASIFRVTKEIRETVNTSESSVYFYKTTWRKIPERCYLYTAVKLFLA